MTRLNVGEWFLPINAHIAYAKALKDLVPASPRIGSNTEHETNPGGTSGGEGVAAWVWVTEGVRGISKSFMPSGIRVYSRERNERLKGCTIRCESAKCNTPQLFSLKFVNASRSASALAPTLSHFKGKVKWLRRAQTSAQAVYLNCSETMCNRIYLSDGTLRA